MRETSTIIHILGVLKKSTSNIRKTTSSRANTCCQMHVWLLTQTLHFISTAWQLLGALEISYDTCKDLLWHELICYSSDPHCEGISIMIVW